MRLTRFLNVPRRTVALVSAVCLVIVLLAASSQLLAARGRAAGNSPATARLAASGRLSGAQRAWMDDGAWFQRLIYLYASGNAPIQQAAVSAGNSAGLNAAQVSAISSAVRAAWLRMMTEDPASVGRVGVKANYAGQRRVLSSLRSALSRVAGVHYSALLTATDRAYATTNSPTWLRANGLAAATVPAIVSRVPGPQRFLVGAVYATSFCILTAQNKCDTSNYVALPDVYVKYASLAKAA